MHDRSEPGQAVKFCACVSLRANLGFYSVFEKRQYSDSQFNEVQEPHPQPPPPMRSRGLSM